MDIVVLLGAFILGLIAGSLSALFGIGGAMFFIPAFRILFGMSGHEAIANTIPLTIPTAAIGAFTFYLRGLVRVRTALLAGLVGVIFSIIGAYMTGLFDEKALMWGVGVLFILLAIITWKNAGTNTRKRPIKERAIRTASIGIVGGFLNGFFGIGGGAIVVPLLMRFKGLSIDIAVPTSLAIIAIYATSGTIAHFAIGNIVLDILIPVMIGSIIGVVIVSERVGEVGEEVRRKWFVAFMILMGLFILIRELLI